jgi:hypothetical protein
LTLLQLDFIKASEAEDIRRQGAEAQRLREVGEAQAAREAALAEREEAQKREAQARQSEAEATKREAEQAKRVAQRTRVGAAVALVIAVVAGWFALNARWAAETANLERDSPAPARSRESGPRGVDQQRPRPGGES